MPDNPQDSAVELTDEQLWQQEAAARTENRPDYDIHSAPPPPPVEPTPDPTDEIKQILDKLGGFETLVTKLTNTVNEQTGRVGAIQRELAQAKNAANVVARAPNAQAVAAASKSLAKWEQLKTDFPDWAEAIEERVGSVAAPEPGPDIAALQSQLQAEVGSLRQAVTMGIEEAKIYGAHRSWKTEVAGAPFAEWFKTLPAEDQAVYNSTSGDEVIRILDKWEEHKLNSRRDVRAERSQILQNAVAPRRGPAPASVDPSTLTAEQLWQAESAQRIATRAQRGR